MAQIWLTNEKMARVFGGTPGEARENSIENCWARQKGRDGVAHVRLPPAMAIEYFRSRIVAIRSAEQGELTDCLVAWLRSVLAGGSGSGVPGRLSVA